MASVQRRCRSGDTGAGMTKVVFAVIIPIIVLLAWVAELQFNAMGGTIIRVKVQGYDPRDLLAGHYINFSLSLPEISLCSDDRVERRGDDHCVCFEPSSDGVYHEAKWGGLCVDKPQNCVTFLQGFCRWGRFAAGVERYSISERIAPAVLTIPPDSSVLIAINHGKGQVIQLLTGEETVETYAERKIMEERRLERRK